MIRNVARSVTFTALLLFAASCTPESGDTAMNVASVDVVDHSAHGMHNTSSSPAPDASVVVSAQADNDAFSVFDLEGSYTDQRGSGVTLRDVAGQSSVLAFIYTSCTSTCPLIVGTLKRLEAGLSPEQRQSVRFLLVSIDPDHDTPARLAQFAHERELDPSRWTLLVTDDATIRQLAVSLDARYVPLSGGEIAHTNGYSLLDAKGRRVFQQAGFTEVAPALEVLRVHH